jgi:hypothetical protein
MARAHRLAGELSDQGTSLMDAANEFPEIGKAELKSNNYREAV